MAQFMKKKETDRVPAIILSIVCNPDRNLDVRRITEGCLLTPCCPCVGCLIQSTHIEYNEAHVMFLKIGECIIVRRATKARDQENTQHMVSEVLLYRWRELSHDSMNVTGKGAPVLRGCRNPGVTVESIVKPEVIEQEIRCGEYPVLKGLLLQVLPVGKTTRFVLSDLLSQVFPSLPRRA
jgi:hypothetical protein